MPRRLRVGIIGVGTIGRLHLEAAQRVGATVVALATSSAVQAAALTKEFDIPSVADYHQLLDDRTVDLVHVCTPNYLHYPMVRDALSAGKHVICEKPLALTSVESADLLERAERSGRVHAIGFNNRFFPLVIEARERVRRGDLGRVFGVRGFILEDSLLAPTAVDWRLDPAVGGESCAMATIGCHLVDLCSFVVGSSIAAVCADFTTVHSTRYRPRRGPTGPGDAAGDPELVPSTSEEVASVLVRFASGTRGVLGVSRATAGRRYKITVEVDGTVAALAWDSETPNQLWQGHDTRPNQILLRDPSLLSDAARRHTSYLGAYQEAFADTVKNLLHSVYQKVLDPDGTNLDVPTFADGHAAQLVQEAVMASARSGRWREVASAGRPH